MNKSTNTCVTRIIFYLLVFSNLAQADVPLILEGTTSVSAEELHILLKEFPMSVIIDTRLPTNKLTEEIKGSIPLPHSVIDPQALFSVAPDKSEPLIFYCEDVQCARSMKAAKKAIDYGYVNVIWFRGGIDEWLKKGYPVKARVSKYIRPPAYLPK